MTTTRQPLTPVERLLVRIEELPGEALYRVAIGFATLPAFSLVFGKDGDGWALGAFFAGLLFMLKVVPAIARRLLGFSSQIQAIWNARRQLAKRYDSYQWQKLFWLGLGLAADIAVSGDLRPSRALLTAGCLVAGAAGLAVWRKRGAGVQFLKQRTPDKTTVG
jgi:hypothetical protein